MFSFPLKTRSTKSQSKTFQIWFFWGGKDDVEQRPEEKTPKNKENETICFHPFVWSTLGMIGACEVILQMIPEPLIMSESWPMATWKAGMIRLL